MPPAASPRQQPTRPSSRASARTSRSKSERRNANAAENAELPAARANAGHDGVGDAERRDGHRGEGDRAHQQDDIVKRGLDLELELAHVAGPHSLKLERPLHVFEHLLLIDRVV